MGKRPPATAADHAVAYTGHKVDGSSPAVDEKRDAVVEKRATVDGKREAEAHSAAIVGEKRDTEDDFGAILAEL